MVIGKFYPLHKGHDYLIRSAKQAAEVVVVIVCERADQKISGDTRAAWIRDEHPDVEVIVTPDDLREEPEPWAQRTLELLQGRRPDLVFSSESYGASYAALMGASDRVVDLDRRTFPISATEIRRDPERHWDMLMPGAKAHLARRVVVTGVESSGTTTLAQELGRHLQTVWVPEHGRWYWEGRRYLADQSWETKEFVGIATAQSVLEDSLARRANRVVVCDTDALTTHVWHRRYVGHWSREVEQLADARQPDLYLVTLPDFPFVQDGTREGEAIRTEMHGWFLDSLQAKGRPYVEIGGPPETRLREALAAISELPPPEAFLS